MTARKIRYGMMTVLAAALAVMIPAAMVGSSFIVQMMDRVLHLKPYSAFVGGDAVAKFYDPIGDQAVRGTAKNPESMDIMRYMVHKPVTNFSSGFDGTPKSFWQVSATLAGPLSAEKTADASGRFMHIYIDLDGAENGSSAAAYSYDPPLQFDKNHPWDILVNIDLANKKGYMVSSSGNNEELIRIIYLEDRRTVYARIPLVNNKIKNVLDNRKTYHYVMCGTESPGAARGMKFLISDYITPIKNNAAPHDNKSKSPQMVYPLEAGDRLITKEPDKTIIEKYSRLALEEKESDKKQNRKYLEKMIAEGAREAELAEAYFKAEEYSRAGELFDLILQKDPGNPKALAYKGTLLAISAGKTRFLGDVMKMMNKSFDYLDKAVTVMNKEGEAAVWLNRGNVSLNAPESVFKRSMQGAGDFANAASVLERRGGDKALISDCYVKAALCCARAGQNERSEMYLLKAVYAGSLKSENKKILVEKGFWEFVANEKI